jgi:hypothetical protein
MNYSGDAKTGNALLEELKKAKVSPRQFDGELPDRRFFRANEVGICSGPTKSGKLRNLTEHRDQPPLYIHGTSRHTARRSCW